MPEIDVSKNGLLHYNHCLGQISLRGRLCSGDTVVHGDTESAVLQEVRWRQSLRQHTLEDRWCWVHENGNQE
jgi:hypothetical protein